VRIAGQQRQFLPSDQFHLPRIKRTGEIREVDEHRAIEISCGVNVELAIVRLSAAAVSRKIPLLIPHFVNEVLRKINLVGEAVEGRRAPERLARCVQPAKASRSVPWSRAFSVCSS
jgi:hypothetical protein